MPIDKPPAISLQEYFEKMIAIYQANMEKSIILARETATEALRLARLEIAEHLTRLNGETGRIQQVLNTTLPRELGEQRFGQIDKAIRELENYKSMVEGKASQNSVIIALVISMIGIVFGGCSLSVAALSLGLRLLGL